MGRVVGWWGGEEYAMECMEQGLGGGGCCSSGGEGNQVLQGVTEEACAGV